jgi:hypothetical protein
MNQRTKVNKTRRRRPLTYVWIFGLALVVALLIYFERTEMLYILATLGVTALLVIVGTADLGQNERSEPIDAQAAGSGIRSTAPPMAKK